MAWFTPNKQGDTDIEFKPEEFKKSITDDVTKEVGVIKTEFAPILEYITKQREKEQKDEEERQRQEQLRQQQNLEVKNEDYLVDPKSATRKEIQPLANSILMLAAKQAKQDTLQDKEYYHGDIKDKVDRMLSQQSLEAQANPDIIANTYKIVVFDHQDKINKGEIKSRASAMSFGNNGTGGHSAGNGSDDSVETLTDDEKKAAARFGISDKEWIASRKELQYV